ncbi:putative ATP synthase subunit f, mitochondrial isoform X1 [Metopolophium dirhodum]|uniref:putative ATP synthase subunit f, mitochondrial isoform X1 n=1 Tax=Metopolophium dirhodum TaxID=44670 RepID=UPI00299081EE|nr:putative ATP synthase subunit f, mitochondrial isoform X1 [Metopolophium dirhodum]
MAKYNLKWNRLVDVSMCTKTNMQKIQDHPAAEVFKGIGDYPAEYNPKVHGPYDPARFYGTPSTPFLELKLYEVPQWLKCRNKSPKSLAALFSRAYWRWSHQYVQPKRTTAAPLIQGLVGMMLIFYIINYGKIIRHRNYKYH